MFRCDECEDVFDKSECQEHPKDECKSVCWECQEKIYSETFNVMQLKLIREALNFHPPKINPSNPQQTEFFYGEYLFLLKKLDVEMEKLRNKGNVTSLSI